MTHKSLKVLLVHDIAGSRAEIAGLLSKTSFSEFELDAVSTERSLRGFRRNYYGICLINSAVKGIWLLKESRRIGFTTPIIVLTSNTAYEVLNAIHHGAADCLVREALTAGTLEESICLVLERTRYKKLRSECASRYRGLLENSSECIYTHDLRGHPTSVSKGFEQMIGYTQEEILNTNFGKILSAESVPLVQRSILRMLENRKPASYEAIMVTRQGERIPVGVTMHLVFEKGGPVEVQGIVRDLSPRTPAASTIAESDQSRRVVITL